MSKIKVPDCSDCECESMQNMAKNCADLLR